MLDLGDSANDHTMLGNRDSLLIRSENVWKWR